MSLFKKAQVQGDFPGGDAAGATAPAPMPDMGAAPAAPTAPDPSLGGMPDLSSMLGGPPAPSAPMAAPAMGDRQEIIGPIESPTQIFYDMDVANFIENNLQFDADSLTKKIWLGYGGTEEGKKDNSKLGERTDDFADHSPEEAQAEREATEDSKWKRLKKGTSIEDIISFSDLGKMVSGLIYGVTQKIFAQGAAPVGGAGGGMAMAANRARIILANNLDREYLFKESDTIIKQLINKIKLS
jgi:hypothetical protein